MKHSYNIKNNDDLRELWKLIPEEMVKISKGENGTVILSQESNIPDFIKPKVVSCFNIDWQGKNAIWREASDKDIGKVCLFWFGDEDEPDVKMTVGVLTRTDNDYVGIYCDEFGDAYEHARPLTNKERHRGAKLIHE